MQNRKEQRDQMMLMITEWQGSGLKQRDYCTTHNISYHVFHYWYGVYRAHNPGSGSFIPLKVTTAACRDQITITGASGIEVQIPFTDQSVSLLKQLLLS